jgi:hypothetical protein
VSAVDDSVRDFFGTTDPPKFRDFLEERKQNSETLYRQIIKGVLRWPDNNSMFRRLSCNRATSKE